MDSSTHLLWTQITVSWYTEIRFYVNNWARKYTRILRILVCGDYLFREVDSFPGTKLDQKTVSFVGKRSLEIEEYINNSLHLARKYARIFVRRHYLFRESNSFPRAQLEENCELRVTDNVQGQYPSIFSPQMEAIVFIILQIFSATRAVLKIGGYSWTPPSFSWGKFGHVTCLDQSRASEKV